MKAKNLKLLLTLSAFAAICLPAGSFSASAGQGNGFLPPLKPGPHAVGSTTIIVKDTTRPFDAWGDVHAITPEYQALLAGHGQF